MKLPVLILLTVAAFITAGAYKSIKTPVSKVAILQNVTDQKQFTIRCSPLYIPGDEDAIPALTGWGKYSWKVTTPSDSAQFYFNQGINMYYAFHIIEARASFDKATRFDPECAMAWWGKALSFGPNINDFGYQRPSEAYPSALKAALLKSKVTPVEKGLIEAMTVRYSDDTLKEQQALNTLYSQQMKTLYKTYPQNENVAALYADALMILHPWDLYQHDYQPKPWTPKIISVLQQTFKLNPQHPGANHYFIHAVEASSKPEDALKSAEFLSSAMPLVSHLTHMPSHIYIRTGNYNKGITVNNHAVSGYNQYLQLFPPVEENVALYELHNEHMRANCAQMAGNYKIAMEASNKLAKKIPAFYLTMPGALGNYVQYLDQSMLFTQIRFGKWADILNSSLADTLTYTPILQHFARGIAYARTENIMAAKTELEKMNIKMDNAVLKEPLAPFNSAYDGAIIAHLLLQGVIAEEQNDYLNAIKLFTNAVEKEDHLIYTEPRDWLLPTRQYLGNCLLKAAKYSQAIAVFNQDLQINPNNGWALTGLAKAYKTLNNKSALAIARKRLNTAWIIKDVPIAAAVF